MKTKDRDLIISWVMFNLMVLYMLLLNQRYELISLLIMAFVININFWILCLIRK